MAITNPLSITYGTRQVGGSTAYQIHEPYVIDRGFENLRLVFDVMVVGSSYANLQSLSDSLEIDFRKRLTHGQTILINISGSVTTYTHGTDLFNAVSSISKSGNPDSDKGFSRIYTISIEAEVHADDDAGLRDIEVDVRLEAGRQRVVTFRGTYTGLSGTDALAQYNSEFDTEQGNYLTAIKSGATFELDDESHSMDRNKLANGTTPFTHVCNFERQLVELLFNQSSGSLDDTDIKDHRVVFTDLSQHPGDSKEKIDRFRRVIGSYDCAADIEQTTDLQALFKNKLKNHIKNTFKSIFNPSVFGIEDIRVSYDETSKRISVALQFIYKKSGGSAIVEISQSVAYREARQLDYTYTHDDDEYAADVDVGFASLERVWSRTVIVLGKEVPKLRITEGPKRGGEAGLFIDRIGALTGPDQGRRQPVVADGWNIVQNTSQVTPTWIGDGDEKQIEVTVLSETVVERFHRKPGQTTSVPIGRGPITQSGGLGGKGGGGT